MGIAENIEAIKKELGEGVTLVAVSKYSPDESVQEAYDAGHRDFGENKAQDVTARQERFPADVRWHFIGHLQRNKTKYIAPYIHLIHSVDSLKLLKEINKQAKKVERVIPVLLQMHIAKEESKFGLDENELMELIHSDELAAMGNVRIEGLMGMATNTEDDAVVRSEFEELKSIFNRLAEAETPVNVEMKTLSMGMSNDYQIAVECGSTMARIGSSVFN
ncbi:MAG TPA: YggS family pyridoxal phosphate-dependent enzyme [Cryomorphaceae bacterium]|nr:YggS family pyridoxal phosphate-dependent enzyme [Cryomorphaceae bacterium]